MRSEYDSAMTRAGNVLASAVGALGVASLLAAGCSSSDAAPAATVVEPTVVETTSPPPATDPPTADAPSTDPGTTITPSTTVDPAAALAAEVEADFLEADRLANEALQDPFSAAKEMQALNRRSGFARDALRQRLKEYRDQNFAIRPSPSVEASMTVESPAVLIAEGGDLAQIQTCEIDPWIVVEVGAGPNGSDAIVEPGLYAYRSTVFLRSIDGSWRIEGGSELERWSGVTECPSD